MHATSSLNIVIPMAGLGSRFSEAGYTLPKPFIPIRGKAMIANVLENLHVPNAKFILIGRQEHLSEHAELIEGLKIQYSATFIPIDQLTEGTACTVLFSRSLINTKTPLLIANSDQIVDSSICDFINDCSLRQLDGSILTFEDRTRNPKWSFAKVRADGLVVEVAEKEPISVNATVGIYYFSEGKTFVDSALDMIINNDRVNNEFYTCPVYNYAIKNGKRIGIYNIDASSMHGIGTPEDAQKYEEKFA